MGRKYNKRLIKDDYSYSVEQVADLSCVSVATVRRWIRLEGLKRIPSTRPHLIHSSELRAFREMQHSKRKKTCASHEVFCFRCQMPRTPKIGSATIILLPNTSIRFNALCTECGGKMNRSIRGVEWAQNHPLAQYLSGALGEHNRVHPTHRECSLQKEDSTCLNITL